MVKNINSLYNFFTFLGLFGTFCNFKMLIFFNIKNTLFGFLVVRCFLLPISFLVSSFELQLNFQVHFSFTKCTWKLSLISNDDTRTLHYYISLMPQCFISSNQNIVFNKHSIQTCKNETKRITCTALLYIYYIQELYLNVIVKYTCRRA